jgi:hypothetical protein
LIVTIRIPSPTAAALNDNRNLELSKPAGVTVARPDKPPNENDMSHGQFVTAQVANINTRTNTVHQPGGRRPALFCSSHKPAVACRERGRGAVSCNSSTSDQKKKAARAAFQ